MTEQTYDPADDPAQQFLNALPPAVRHHINHTARLTVLVHRAVRNGWTVPQLVERCTGDLGANPGGTITYRLERDSDGPPPLMAAAKVHQGCCEDGWIYDETSDPPRQTKCPGNMREVTA